jgi:hypothetical protein
MQARLDAQTGGSTVGGKMMPRNNQKNSTKSNSNLFELLSEIEDDGTNKNEISSSTNATGTSARGRPLKRSKPYDPESPPQKKSVSTKPGLLLVLLCHYFDARLRTVGRMSDAMCGSIYRPVVVML